MVSVGEFVLIPTELQSVPTDFVNSSATPGGQGLIVMFVMVVITAPTVVPVQEVAVITPVAIMVNAMTDLMVPEFVLAA